MLIKWISEMGGKLPHLCSTKNRTITHSYSSFVMHILEHAQTGKNIKRMV